MQGSGSARAVLPTVLTAALFAGIAFSDRIDIFAQTSASKTPSGQAGSKTFHELAARADSARDANHLEEATKLYHRALVLNPKWAEGWWSLGTLEYDNGRYAEAELAFGKVVVLDPKQGTARAMLGLCEFEMGQNDRALKDIEASKTLGVLEDKQLRDVVTYHEAILLQRTGH